MQPEERSITWVLGTKGFEKPPDKSAGAQKNGSPKGAVSNSGAESQD